MFALSPYCCMLSGEATNTNFIVFGLIRSGLEPMTNRTLGKYANNYTTDTVLFLEESDNKAFFFFFFKYFEFYYTVFTCENK
jgi:hypothetical protein